jgi:hypothetical protein
VDGLCRHQTIWGSDPNHQGIWSPPRAGYQCTFYKLFAWGNHLCVCVCLLLHQCVYYCSTYYKVVRVGGASLFFLVPLVVFITTVCVTKLFAGGGGGGGTMEDMCYEGLRGEACVD